MMPVNFSPPPATILKDTPEGEGRSWPLPPIYCAAIGSLVISSGHIEAFLKRLAFAMNGAPEAFSRLMLGGASASAVRDLLAKMLPNSPFTNRIITSFLGYLQQPVKSRLNETQSFTMDGLLSMARSCFQTN